MPKEIIFVVDDEEDKPELVRFNFTEEKNVNVELRCDADIKTRINPPLLEQAFVNLLDNAIKYSDAGSNIQRETIHLPIDSR